VAESGNRNIKKGRSVLCAGADVKYAFIKQQSQQHSVTQLVNALDVSSSGYHVWIKRDVSQREKANQLLIKKIEILHKASRYVYGSPRIHQDLRVQGERVS
jgi:putative transposase